MKLAEALILRSDMQKKYQLLVNRIEINLKGQEGESPSENPEALIRELEKLVKARTGLIQKINHTNQVTKLKSKLLLSEAIAKRDGLLKLASQLHNFSQSAGSRSNRYSKSELKEVSFVNVENLRHKADKYSEEARQLDTQIQEMNWLTDLVD